MCIGYITVENCVTHPYVERDANFHYVFVYFLEHFNDYSCASCLNVLEKDDKYIDALNQKWHLDCFRFVLQYLIILKKG